MKKIVAIGEIILDLIGIDTAESLKDTTKFEVFYGGSPANFIHYMQLFSRPCQLVATVGNDAFGEKAIENAFQNKIDISLIRKDSTARTSLILINKSTTAPSFLSYRSADAEILPEQVNKIDLANTLLLHTTAFALSKNPAQSSIIDLLDKAHAQGVNCSVDFNFSNQIWNENKALGQEILGKLAQIGSFIKVSKDDVRRLMGYEMEAQEFIPLYLKKGASLVCYTDGSNGAYAATNENEIFYQPANVVDVVDTTGAGDSFWAGFLDSYLQYNDIAVALAFGSSIAERKLQKTGPLTEI